MKAPDFNLPDQTGTFHKLSDYAGKWLILYFYPKDDTPGCTKEACNFRDNISEYEKRGVKIVGISKDSPKSHAKFAQKFHLNFPLLADESGEVVEKYGVWGKKTTFGHTYMGIFRTTFLINPKGEIVKKYEGVNPKVHSDQILKDLEELL